MLIESEYARYFITKADKQKNIGQREFFTDNLTTMEEDARNLTHEGFFQPLLQHDVKVERKTISLFMGARNYSGESDCSFRKLYCKTWFLALQITICFAITFTVFPGTSLSTTLTVFGTGKKNEAWFSVTMITIFNVFDTLGRYIAGKIALFNKNSIIILSTIRLLFIPSFILIQLKYYPDWIFGSDQFKVINMVLFAITNGIASTT